ncbi:MAG: hypothetical protein A2V66_09830, partial [Ignavibacteria bacterium RBG_13_36_8]
VDYDFRPSSTFYYLTGFEEPNAAAVIRNTVYGGNGVEFIMFVEEREGTLVNWLGPVYGPDGAVEYFGADSAYTFDRLGTTVTSYINSGVYGNIYSNLNENNTVAVIINDSGTDTGQFLSVTGLVDQLRVIKSSVEIALIRNATNVSVQAFTEAINRIEPGMYEYEVDAIMNLILRLNGCPRNAFPTIVASGPNITTLHYPAGTRQMLDGDLVMIDYGAEYGYYTSDLTRTLPVNGSFSTEQRAVYEIVLETHKAIIDLIAPGVSYYYLYNLNIEMMIDGLLEKGIITGNRSEIISSRRYYQYIPAGLAHPVGLDVHDPFPAEANRDKILKENMVMAFEPHIYLYQGDQSVNSAYWTISARIEDTILITANGYEILSSSLPIEIADIEALMR